MAIFNSYVSLPEGMLLGQWDDGTGRHRRTVGAKARAQSLPARYDHCGPVAAGS